MTEDEAASKVDVAILTAQRDGQAMLDEMIAALDHFSAFTRSSMRVHLRTYGDSDVDLTGWARRLLALEAAHEFLARLNDDDKLRDTIKRNLAQRQRMVSRRPRQAQGDGGQGQLLRDRDRARADTGISDGDDPSDGALGEIAEPRG